MQALAAGGFGAGLLDPGPRLRDPRRARPRGHGGRLPGLRPATRAGCRLEDDARTPIPSPLYRFKREFRALADIAHPNLVGAPRARLERTATGSSRWNWSTGSTSSRTSVPAGRAGSSRPLTERRICDRPRSSRRSSPSSETVRSMSGSRPGSIGSGRLVQLAEGVAALHEAGRLHRDLKPSNVLVTREGRVVILDFGSAPSWGRPVHHRSSTPISSAPPPTCPPSRRPVDRSRPASDWYSVGVMLYEALTGRLPFVGGAARRCSWTSSGSSPAAPTSRAPDVPDDLDALCVELLRRDPRPGPAGREVLRGLGVGRGHAGGRRRRASQPGPARPLVGRERHLGRARATRSAALRRGGTVVVLVHGRSGVGKSALVADGSSTSLPARRRPVVLAGRCYEQESVPYKALDSLIDALEPVPAPPARRRGSGILPRDFPYLLPGVPRASVAEAEVDAARGECEVIPDPQELRRRAVRRPPRPPGQARRPPAAGPVHRRPAVGRRRQRGTPGGSPPAARSPVPCSCSAATAARTPRRAPGSRACWNRPRPPAA